MQIAGIPGPELGTGIMEAAIGSPIHISGGAAGTKLGKLAAAEKDVLENVGKQALDAVDDETRPLIENMLRLAGDLRKATMMTPSKVMMGHPQTIKTVEDALKLAASKQEKPSMLSYLRRVNNHLMDVLQQLNRSTVTLKDDLTKSFEQRLYDKVRSGDLTPDQAMRILQQHKGPPPVVERAAAQAAPAPATVEAAPKVLEQQSGPGSVIRRRAGEETALKQAAPKAAAARPAAPKVVKAARKAVSEAVEDSDKEESDISIDEAESYYNQMTEKK